MTPEQINIAIAESLGWRFVPSHDVRGKAVPDCWIHDEFPAVWADYPRDYTANLNAMHKVEKILSLDGRNKYYSHLWNICDKTHRMASVGGWLVPTATALQRAEAYLRTIGKWNEKD